MADEVGADTWGLVLRFAELMKGAPGYRLRRPGETHAARVSYQNPQRGERFSGPWSPDVKGPPTKSRQEGTGQITMHPGFHVPLWSWLYRGGGTGQADPVALLEIHQLWLDGFQANSDTRQSRIWSPRLSELGIFLEDPPLRDAPTNPPEITDTTAIAVFIDSHQQVGWWGKTRRQPSMAHLRAHARSQLKAWNTVRDAAEPTARDQLRRSVEYIETHQGTPYAGTSPADLRKLIGAGTWS